MRKNKKRSAAVPYAAGAISGFAVTLFASALGAAAIAFSGITGLSVIISICALAAGCFFGGSTAGRLKRSGGLKTGALCGLIMFSVLLMLSLIFGQCGGRLLIIKAAVCVAFGAAGGVFGVNKSYGTA